MSHLGSLLSDYAQKKPFLVLVRMLRAEGLPRVVVLSLFAKPMVLKNANIASSWITNVFSGLRNQALLTT
jgi:hypothetical protein